MKIIDRYLVKQFLGTLFFGILAFTLLFVIIDMMENLDDFIDQSVPARLIFEYYFVFMPEIIRLMTPVSILLSALFTSGKMSNLNELTALKSSGISIYRYMVPFAITAFFLSLASVYFGGYTVPAANKHKIFIEQTYMKKGIVYAGSNIYFQDSKNKIVTISHFDTQENQASQVSIQTFDPINSTKMVQRIDATRMRYDSSTTTWTLFEGIIRSFTDSTEYAENFATKVVKDINFSPMDIIKKQTKPEEMTLTELSEYAAEQSRTGNDPINIQIEYHSRIAYAFAGIIVVLFGIPISANKRKGGLAMQFGVNLLITFVYLVFMKVSQAFGKNGVVSPFITAWLANFIFLIGALINIYRVRK